MNAREYRQHRHVTLLMLANTAAIVGLVCFVAGMAAASYSHLLGALLSPIHFLTGAP